LLDVVMILKLGIWKSKADWFTFDAHNIAFLNVQGVDLKQSHL